MLSIAFFRFRASYRRPVFGRVRLELESLEERSTPTVIPIAGAQDLTFDSARQLLYVTTSVGKVERYSIGNQSLLTPYNVGAKLNAADITQNGAFLYVTEDTLSSGKGVIHKVNLTTGQVTNLATPDAANTTDIAIANNGQALVAGSPMRYIDLSTDNVTLNIPSAGDSISSFSRSADRSKMIAANNDSSTGPLFIYTSSDNSYSQAANLGTYVSGPSAANRNGTLFAFTIGTNVAVFDGGFHAIANLENASGGFAFSPKNDLFLAADTIRNQIVAYDTNSWAEKYRLPAGESLESAASTGRGIGTMAISDDGRRAFLITNSGVRQYILPQSTGVASNLSVDVTRFVRQDTITSVTITALDAAGNVATGYRGTISFSVAGDQLASLPPPYTFTASDRGSRTFQLKLQTPGTQSLVVSDASASQIMSTALIQVHAPGAADYLPISNAHDLIVDAIRNILYVTTNDGTIERYDISTESLLTPLVVGNSSIQGGDMSLDGNFLYVTEGPRNVAESILLKVDLATGKARKLTYPSVGGGWDIAIAANGTGLITDQGYNFSPVNKLNTTTDSISPSDIQVIYKSAIARSSDRNRVFILGANISNGPIQSYTSSTDRFSGAFATGSHLQSAIASSNRDGSLLAFSQGSTTFVRSGDNLANLVRSFPGRAGGTLFDPTSDRFFIADKNSSSLYVYSTSTWSMVDGLSIGTPLGVIGQFGNGVMNISPDATQLFIVTPAGIRVLNLAGLPLPLPSAGGPYAVIEGESLTLSGAPVLPPVPDETIKYSWDINGDGVFSDANGLNPTLTWDQLSNLGIYNAPATRTVSMRAEGASRFAVATSALTISFIAEPPTVVSIRRHLPDTSITNSNSVTFLVTFNKPVVRVGVGAFSLGSTGITVGLPWTVVPVNSSQYLFTVPVTGNGTIVAGISNVTAIVDHSGRRLVRNPNGVIESYQIDQRPPTLTIASVPPATTTGPTATFVFSGEDPVVNNVASGIRQYQMSLDGAGYVDVASPLTLNGLTAGNHVVNIRSVDNAGNISAPSLYSWATVLAPRVFAITPRTGLPSGGAVVTIEGANLFGLTAVNFGPISTTTFTVVSANQITAIAPPGVGVVDLSVTNLAGTSIVTSAGSFAYVKQVPVITWRKPGDIVYGTPLSDSQLNAIADVPGTFVYSAPAGTVLSAGSNQTIRVTFTPTDAMSNEVVVKSILINVAKAPLTIRVNDITVTGIYEYMPVLSATYIGWVNGDTPVTIGGVKIFVQTTPIIVSGIPLRLPPRAPSMFGPGKYLIVAAVGVSANYEITVISGTLTVLR